MFRTIICSLLLSLVAAERVQVHAFNSRSQLKFGATCEELESSFHDRVTALQVVLDAHPNDNTLNTATRARLTMRTLGIARTLRRARSCPWVIDGDGDDIAQIRGIVQVMLAGNPCAPAARAELERSGPDDMAAVGRAMSVLASETCEVSGMTDEESPLMISENESELEAQLDQAEQGAHNSVDDLIEVSMSDEDSSFVEAGSEGRFGGFFRSLGVLFLVLLLLLACTSAAALIGALILQVILAIGFLSACQHFACQLGNLFMSMMMGGAVGFVGCAYALATQLLPTLALDQPALS